MRRNRISKMQANEEFMFKVGDTVYYPGKGICRVKTVFKRRQATGNEPVFILKPKNAVSNLQRLALPLGKARELGVHKLSLKTDVAKVWQTLDTDPHVLSDDKRRGFKTTKEKVYSGDLTKVAEAVRDLNVTRGFVFFGGRRYLLNVAKRMLIEEVAYIRGEPDKKIERQVAAKLSKAAGQN